MLNKRDQYRCFLDCTTGESCVFDDGKTTDCDLAVDLESQGKDQKECAHWLHIQTMRDRLNRVKAEDKTIIRIEKAARNQREQRLVNELNELERMVSLSKEDEYPGFLRKWDSLC